MTTPEIALLVAGFHDDVDARLLTSLVGAALRDRVDDEDRIAAMIALVGWILAATGNPNATMRTVVSALSAEHRLV